MARSLDEYRRLGARHYKPRAAHPETPSRKDAAGSHGTAQGSRKSVQPAATEGGVSGQGPGFKAYP